MTGKFEMKSKTIKNTNITELKKIHTCWETTGKLEDLIDQAKDCIQYLKEDGVGYYYMSMLEELIKINKKSRSPQPK